MTTFISINASYLIHSAPYFVDVVLIKVLEAFTYHHISFLLLLFFKLQSFSYQGAGFAGSGIQYRVQQILLKGR